MAHLLKRELSARRWRRAWHLLSQPSQQQPWPRQRRYLSPDCYNNNDAVPAAAAAATAAMSLRWMSSSQIAPQSAQQPTASPLQETLNADEEMLAMLDAEIKRETDVGDTEDINRVPPSPFYLHEQPGRLEVMLRRKYESEDVSIRCIYSSGMIPDDPEESGSEAQQSLPEMVHMIVSVSKGLDQPLLEITCLTNGEELHVETVVCSKEPSSNSSYAAAFVDLKDDLQHQLNQFLKLRGINKEFCGFLMTLMPEKERQEYIGWLKRIEAFVRS